MKTAMFGGSFNPVHLGHVKLVKKAMETFSLDKVIIMPTYSTPLKDNSEFADADARYDMCCLAFENIDGAEVSDMEIRREGKSYTYLTLISLKELYPDDELYLIIGADMFMTIDKWMKPDVIFDLANIIVVPRNGGSYDIQSQAEKLREKGCRAFLMDKPVYDVSSTEIREKLRQNEDLSLLLDEKVLEYIKSGNLYGY